MTVCLLSPPPGPGRPVSWSVPRDDCERDLARPDCRPPENVVQAVPDRNAKGRSGWVALDLGFLLAAYAAGALWPGPGLWLRNTRVGDLALPGGPVTVM